MKLFTLLIAPLLSLSSYAQDPAQSGELIVAAIGEIPVPVMKTVEVKGQLPYQTPDMESSNQWFPEEWSVAGQSLKLSLNNEPASTRIPADKEPVILAPRGAAPRLQTIPPELLEPAEKAATLMVIYNGKPGKTWAEGFASRFVACSKFNSATPSAMVLNLSGAVLSITVRNNKVQQIAPGKSAIAMVHVDPKNGLNLLQLSAAAAGETYSLDVVPLDLRAPWSPVVVVYPSTGPSSKMRPLRLTVIQPSDAVKITPQKAPAVK